MPPKPDPQPAQLKHVSLKQLAREVGCSESTVCHILNGSERYAQKTRDRVLEAADRLKYRPNQLVKSLVSGRTRMVGVMIPPSDGFHGHMIRGIHDALTARDHAVILAFHPANITDPADESERQVIHRLVERRVDGIILRPTADAAPQTYFNEIWERRLPLVVVDRQLAEVDADFVGSDDEGGGRRAAEHLLHLGHRRVAVMGYYPKASPFRLRQAGFEDRIKNQADCSLTRLVDDDHACAVRLAREALGRPDRPTAVFCVNDTMARSLYDVAQKLKLSIPGDLSVVGFGDQTFGPWMSPPLTSFDQSPYDLGRAAATRLLSRLDDPPPPGNTPQITRQPVILVKRASTAPPTNAVD